MGEDERNPFKRKNVVAAMLGYEDETLAPGPKPDLPTAVDVLEKDMAARERQAKMRKMKPWERNRYLRDQQRVRLTVYIPEPLSELIDTISEEMQASPSSVAAWLIDYGLQQWEASKVVAPQVIKSRNFKVKKALKLPDRWDGPSKERTFDLPGYKERIYAIVQRFGCGRSAAVSWLMSIGADAYSKGEAVPEREPSESVRFPFRLVIGHRSKVSLKRLTGGPRDTIDRFFDDSNG